tara:strand:+ start:236 stop:556 length:321 start_codon:yes stop_codon:yes gene_type:complete
MSSDYDLKKTADMKQWLEKKIHDTEIELTNLKDTLEIVDGILKASSFQPAKSIKHPLSEVKSSPSMRTYKKSCNKCNVEIEMRKVGEKWGAYTIDSDLHHKCDGYD